MILKKNQLELKPVFVFALASRYFIVLLILLGNSICSYTITKQNISQYKLLCCLFSFVYIAIHQLNQT